MAVKGTLEDYLRDNKIIGISEIDTRALVRHIRTRGALRGCIATGEINETEALDLARKSPGMTGQDLASRVTCPTQFEWKDANNSVEQRFHVVAYDFGVKYDILRQLAGCGCRITVVPSHTSAEDVLAMNPDGIFLSNGTGDPEPLTDVVDNLRKLIGKRPIFGICLGHQLLGLAFGGRTFKLKFGHRGGNQPVLNKQTGKVEITAQNHGFAVDADSINDPEIEITHLNLNDNTNEGLRHKRLPVFSVQYHPEAAPGRMTQIIFLMILSKRWKRIEVLSRTTQELATDKSAKISQIRVIRSLFPSSLLTLAMRLPAVKLRS